MQNFRVGCVHFIVYGVNVIRVGSRFSVEYGLNIVTVSAISLFRVFKTIKNKGTKWDNQFRITIIRTFARS